MKIYFLLFTALMATAFIAPVSPQQAATRSEQLTKQCINCHEPSNKIGPSLKYIRKQRSKEWIYAWVQNPDYFANTNREANRLFRKYNMIMTAFALSNAQIDSVLDYIDRTPQIKDYRPRL